LAELLEARLILVASNGWFDPDAVRQTGNLPMEVAQECDGPASFSGRAGVSCAGREDGFGGLEIFFGIDADGVAGGGGDVDGDPVVEETELFEALDTFEPGGRERGEAIKGGFAVSVDAEMLAIAGEAGVFAVVRDGGAGEVESAVIAGGDDFNGVGIEDVGNGTMDGEGGDLDFGALEELQHRCEVIGSEEGLVALDVDVDVGGDGLGYGVDAVGATGAIFGGEDGGERVGLGEAEDLVGVGGDENLVEEGTGAGGAIDPGEHGFAGDFAEDFAGQTGGAEAGGDDGENVAEVRGQWESSGIVYLR
jgi:hypothetical protein